MRLGLLSGLAGSAPPRERSAALPRDLFPQSARARYLFAVVRHASMLGLRLSGLSCPPGFRIWFRTFVPSHTRMLLPLRFTPD